MTRPFGHGRLAADNFASVLTLYYAEFHPYSSDGTMTGCRVGVASALPGNGEFVGSSSYSLGWINTGGAELNNSGAFAASPGAWDATSVLGIGLMVISAAPTSSKSGSVILYLDGVPKAVRSLKDALVGPVRFACSLGQTGAVTRTLTYVPAATDWLAAPRGAVEYDAASTMIAQTGGSVTGGDTCNQGTNTANPYWSNTPITVNA